MKTRSRRRLSTRSADHEMMAWRSVRAMKPNATTLMTTGPGADVRQLNRLIAATRTHGTACHGRSRNASTNSAVANSHSTTTLAVDSATSGARHNATGDANPAAEHTA